MKTTLNFRSSQQQRILALLESANGEWVPLPKILALFIANYRARISELRQAGHSISMKDWYEGDQRHTAYRISLNKTA